MAVALDVATPQKTGVEVELVLVSIEKSNLEVVVLGARFTSVFNGDLEESSATHWAVS